MKIPYQLPFANSPLKILADADLVLELILKRSTFVEDAQKLLMEIAKLPQVEIYVTDKCLKRVSLEALDKTNDPMIESLINILDGHIIKIDDSIKEKARNYPLKDFDSAEEVVCAIEMQLNTIVTQNPQNFDGSTLGICSVGNLLNVVQLERTLEKNYLFCQDSSGIPQHQLNQDASQSAAKLRDAGLHGTDLHDIDLPGVDLSGVNLCAINSYGANLCNANLSCANLCDADLSNANLSGANLSGANLIGADLIGTNLSDAVVEKAVFGKNYGLSDELELDLKRRGAIFEHF